MYRSEQPPSIPPQQPLAKEALGVDSIFILTLSVYAIAKGWMTIKEERSRKVLENEYSKDLVELSRNFINLVKQKIGGKVMSKNINDTMLVDIPDLSQTTLFFNRLINECNVNIEDVRKVSSTFTGMLLLLGVYRSFSKGEDFGRDSLNVLNILFDRNEDGETQEIERNIDNSINEPKSKRATEALQQIKLNPLSYYNKVIQAFIREFCPKDESDFNILEARIIKITNQKLGQNIELEVDLNAQTLLEGSVTQAIRGDGDFYTALLNSADTMTTYSSNAKLHELIDIAYTKTDIYSSEKIQLTLAYFAITKWFEYSRAVAVDLPDAQKLFQSYDRMMLERAFINIELDYQEILPDLNPDNISARQVPVKDQVERAIQALHTILPGPRREAFFRKLVTRDVWRKPVEELCSDAITQS